MKGPVVLLFGCVVFIIVIAVCLLIAALILKAGIGWRTNASPSARNDITPTMTAMTGGCTIDPAGAKKKQIDPTTDHRLRHVHRVLGRGCQLHCQHPN